MKRFFSLVDQSRQSQRGIALISVLAMVMLLTGLMVAFMMRAGSEKQSSGYYRAEATTRELSDTTLNLVEGEINEATTQGINYAWSSQPGAIRVFDNNGNPAKVFKLYSAPTMVADVTSLADVQAFLTDSAVSATPDIPVPGSWYTAPGMWVDLNAPVNSDPNPNSSGLGSSTYTHFPILDPRLPSDFTKLLSDINPSTKLPYMDGFAINSAPTDTSGTTASYIDSNNKPNPAPMPVKWLYVLQDGTLTAPNAGPDASGNYTFPSTPLNATPNTTNPIVGRIAFWTDDETCKVNVNTAGADGIMGETVGKDRADPSVIATGTFWSPPYFAAPDDTGLTVSQQAPGSGPFLPGYCTAQPAAAEYQRYPGHPSTVALSNIFNSLGATVNTTTFYSQSNLGTGTQYITGPGVTPRYVFGGSQENTIDTFNANPYGVSGYNPGIGLNTSAEPISAYRLYPSLSESLFHPDRSTATNLNTASATARQRMEVGRFFLTAHSRAPELNLFGLPRVAIWPLAYNTALRTTVDNLLGFCSTIGGTQGNASDGDAYYFSRFSSYDSTVDIGLKDSSGNYRNAYLLNYLDYLTTQNIPGFGGNFYSKNYGGGLTGQNDQILTEIFDYIRATNIQDATSASPYGLPNWQGSWWGVGQVVPSLINSSNSGGILNWNTQGFASFPRLAEFTLQFVAMGVGGTPANAYGPNNPPSPIPAVPINPAFVHYAFPFPMPASYAPPALPPAPNSTAYNAFASVNPLGYLLGYPQTPPSPLPPYAPGDAPFPNTLTYAYNPLQTGLTVIKPTLDYPYPQPGGIDTNFTPAPPAPGTAPYTAIYRIHNYATGQDSAIPPDGTVAVECFLVLTFINPAQDWIYCSPYVWTTVTGLDSLGLNGHPLGFPHTEAMVFGSGQDWHGGGRSGYYPIDCSYQARGLSRSPGNMNPNPTWGYPFFSNIIPVTSNNSSALMTLNGATIGIKLYDATGGAPWPPPTPDANSGAPLGVNGNPPGHLVQTYTINVPSSSTPSIGVPILPPNPTPVAASGPGNDYSYPANSALPLDGVNNPLWNVPTHGTNNPYKFWIRPRTGWGTATTSWTGITLYSMEETGPQIGLPDAPASYSQIWNMLLTPVPGDTNITIYNRWNEYGALVSTPDENLIGSGDTVISMVPTQKWSDPRLFSISNVPSTAWTTHPNWGGGARAAHNLYWGMVLPLLGNGGGDGWWGWWGSGMTWPTSASMGTLAGNVVDPQPAGWPTYAWAPSIFGDNKSPTTVSGAPPDWDSGLTTGSDGPWVNKADEGSATYNAIPYYANPVNEPSALFSANREIPSPGMFGSLPTGVDISGNNPQGWQTLLFRPGPGAAGYPANTHPGEGVPAVAGVYSPPYSQPPDHLWMDLFWIPITEPYAISEPMSTAGKINLNYQILPFTYIRRATALRAALATEKITQVGLKQSATCKGNGYEQGVCVNGPYTSVTQCVNCRFPIDLDVTLSQFDKKFSNWDVFRSASQICEEFLVPMDIPNTLPHGIATANTTTNAYSTGQTITPTGNYALPSPQYSGDTTGVQAFALDWYTPVPTPQNPANYTNAPFAMVGDNLREQPYTHMYGKLTTKSNTYTVYYRVQSLRKPASVAAGSWNENLGTITGEYRGSTTIERFIDPNEKTSNGANVVPDAAAQIAGGTAPTSLEAYYKWRTVENHQFAP